MSQYVLWRDGWGQSKKTEGLWVDGGPRRRFLRESKGREERDWEDRGRQSKQRARSGCRGMFQNE